MQRTRMGSVAAAAVAACAMGSAVHAAPEYAAVEVNEGIFVTPSINIEERYDDNIFQTDSNEKDSLVTVTSPGINIDMRKDRAQLAVSYAGEVGWYHDSAADNYQDHLGQAIFGLKGSRSSLNLRAFHEREHDDRGTGPSNGFGVVTTTVFDEPTEYQRAGFDGGVDVTLVERWRVGLGGGLDNTNYKNFRAITVDRDRESNSRSAGVYFQVTPKTEVLAEVSRKEIEYDNTPIVNNVPGVSLDSQETRYLGGVTWQATAKTSGTVKIGVLDKNFEDGRRNDRNNASWDILITYEPVSYSKLSFDSYQGQRETDGQGDTIQVQRFGVRWEHAWNDRLGSNVAISQTEEDYEGDTRSDDFTSVELGLEYDWDRWLTFSGGYRFSTRDSSLAGVDFDRNVLYFRASAGL